MTGDRSVWCVLKRGPSVFDGAVESDRTALTTRVINSQGTAVAADQFTNVLSRPDFPEDPQIGCEGTHDENIYKILYVEAGIDGGPAYHQFKDQRGGIDIFIR